MDVWGKDVLDFIGRATAAAKAAPARRGSLAVAGWLQYGLSMEGAFEEAELFAAIAASGARALLIGRRALVALGLPVLTADYDLWIHADDAVVLNAALAPFRFFPTLPPSEARARGRYVLENDERIDVLVARAIGTVDGSMVQFDDVWSRRQLVEGIAVPALDDLIATKRFGGRPKDAEDIRLLESLRRP